MAAENTIALSLMQELEHALLALDRTAALSVLASANFSDDSFEIIEGLIAPALERIGAGWERGEIALSQVYMAGRICEELVDDLLPPADVERRRPRMAIAVLEDYHMLGKRIVYSVLRSGGFELADYGQMKSGDLVERVKHDGIRILLISTLMLPSALKVKDVREGLDRAGADVKIVVGGAPFRFDDRLWKEVRADGTARTASGAIEIVRKFWEELP
jgi:methanogenic corrinoid protein MtbC1